MVGLWVWAAGYDAEPGAYGMSLIRPSWISRKLLLTRWKMTVRIPCDQQYRLRQIRHPALYCTFWGCSDRIHLDSGDCLPDLSEEAIAYCDGVDRATAHWERIIVEIAPFSTMGSHCSFVVGMWHSFPMILPHTPN